MSKPFPIIKLETLADHERLFRALYALDYHFYGAKRSIEKAWISYRRDIWREERQRIDYPVVAITLSGDISLWEADDSDYMNPNSTYIKMNSIRHFAEYAARHREEWRVEQAVMQAESENDADAHW